MFCTKQNLYSCTQNTVLFKDYNKFLNIADKYLPETMQLVHYKKNKGTIHYSAKIEDTRFRLVDHTASIPRTVNLWIDIFPLDGMPENVFLRKIHSFRLLYLRAMFKYSLFDRIVNQSNRNRPRYEMILVDFGKVVKLEKVLKPERCMEKLDNALSKYDFYESKFVMNFMGSYKLKSVMDREKIYADGAQYEFEGFSLNGPANYDVYLSQIYGDYMKLPPENERNWRQTTIVDNFGISVE